MSEKKKVKINGFVFTDEAEAEQAKKVYTTGQGRSIAVVKGCKGVHSVTNQGDNERYGYTALRNG